MISKAKKNQLIQSLQKVCLPAYKNLSPVLKQAGLPFQLCMSLHCAILFLMLLFTFPAFGQRENNWVFDDNAGVSFSSGSPVAFQTNINAYESCASVSDTSGHLLFYTDGDTIYNSNGQIMTNGSGLTGQPNIAGVNDVNSTTQGSLIVPMPDSADKYYVFSLSSSSGGALHPGRLYYSIVDMSLNNGMGNVVPNRKGIMIDSSLTENMTGVEGDHCDIWVLVRSRIGFQFKAFDITSSGLNTTPVISGSYINANITIVDTSVFAGGMAVSPGRKKLASVLIYGSSAANSDFDFVELDDFDPVTGIVSNRVILDSNEYVYKCAFSPDNSKLYCSSSDLIFQYDLNQPDPASIIASQYYVGFSSFSDIKLAPDKRIYFFTDDMNLGVIEQPNLAGSACVYNDNAVTLLPNTFGIPGLPNVVPEINEVNTSFDSAKIVCFADSIILQVTDSNASGVMWDDESTNYQRTVYSPGIYSVAYSTPPCTHHTDSFTVSFFNTQSVKEDTTVCTSPPVTLLPPISNASYLWQDGSTNSTYNALSSGNYYVQIKKDACAITDSISVSFINLKQDLGNDTIICKEDIINWMLTANMPIGTTALWSNGSTASKIPVTDSGIYWVMVSDSLCAADNTGSDTVHIDAEVCNCIVSMPNAFTPNGDNKNDVLRPIIEPGCSITYMLRIFNRWGQLVSAISNEGHGWDGTQNGVMADIGTYMYTLEYESALSHKRQYLKGDVTLIR